MADFPYPMVSTRRLADNLGAPDLRVIDASWRMPGAPSARSAFDAAHIPGAVFFDSDEFSDKNSALPHTLLSPEDFALAVGAYGISGKDRIVVYDDAGLFSAARIWWMFRAMGHEAVSVLDGGLPKWRRENRPITNEYQRRLPTLYSAGPRRAIVRNANDVREFLCAGDGVIMDARAAARFSGETPEPRPGMRSGHMPGAINVPYTQLLTETGEMKSPAELQRVFDEAGDRRGAPVITTCGSGVTAAVLSLALEILGRPNHALYDGSWSEWGAASNDPRLFPVVTG